jgi:hypothetical protein
MGIYYGDCMQPKVQRWSRQRIDRCFSHLTWYDGKYDATSIVTPALYCHPPPMKPGLYELLVSAIEIVEKPWHCHGSAHPQG